MGNDMAKLIDIKKAISLLLAGTLLLGGCGVKETGNTKEATAEDQFSEEIVIGFSQLGAESDWRTANTQSMKDTFTADKGYRLIVEDGQQQ